MIINKFPFVQRATNVVNTAGGVTFIFAFLLIAKTTSLFPGIGSDGNLEQWMNITNTMFYGSNDMLFSYGPLFWLFGGATTQYSALTHIISITFMSVIGAFYWSTGYLLSRSAGRHVLFVFAYILFGGLVSPIICCILSPLMIVLLIDRLNKQQSALPSLLLIALAVLTVVYFYIRFFFGILACATFGLYLFSRFISTRSAKEMVVFSSAVLVGYSVFGLLIFHNVESIIRYILVNRYLSFGNSVEMVYDIKSNPLRVALVPIVSVLLSTYIFIYNRRAFLSFIFVTFVLIKLGLSRQDHFVYHYVAAIAGMLCIFLFERGKAALVAFAVCLLITYHMSFFPLFPNAPVFKPLTPQVSYESAYLTRMAAHYREYKLSDIAAVVKDGTVETYPNNNEYIFANEFKYVMRPSFQSYMTLTPELDAMNQAFFESPDKPQFVLWASAMPLADPDSAFLDVDGRYLLNEDPLTSTTILLNYHVVTESVGRYRSPVVLLEKNETAIPYAPSDIGSEDMTFGQWYKVPSSTRNVVKVIPHFEPTLLGKLQNLFFRGDPLYVSYKLRNGSVARYRLNILNSVSGVWVSPLVGRLNFTGEGVEAVMFETKDRDYVKPTFKASWIGMDIPGIRERR